MDFVYLSLRFDLMLISAYIIFLEVSKIEFFYELSLG